MQIKAQVRVTFIIDTPYSKTDGNIFFAGNLNGWAPADSAYIFRQNELKINVPAGKYIEFKLTKGDWSMVETDAGGKNIPNRVLTILNDTTVYLKVQQFKDPLIPFVKNHTASENVSVLDTAFFIPGLNRTRTIRLYLPPGYQTNNKKYPVLYLADGQNIFDEFTANMDEWKVDETLDRFYDSCKKSMIVVAVDHGNELRLQEYQPYAFERVANPEGKAYASFLANTLKPFIDSHLRTKSSGKFTHVAGSSMGALISMYTIISYPKQFGNAGIFSPSFWTTKSIYGDAKANLKSLKNHVLFFYAGGKESKSMEQDTREMYLLLQGARKLKSKIYIDKEAQHNEAAWSKWFPIYLKSILQ
ncbi:MAG: alpha/beta hydrolase-fold protein [Bacteroidota bacterium]